MMDDVAHELKSRREAKGLSVEDIFSRTRINVEFIRALEAGDFHVLPDAYIRLFLKNVALEVDADPDEIIRAYDRIAKREAREEPASSQRTEGNARWVVTAAASVIVAGSVGLVLLNRPPQASSPPEPTDGAASASSQSVASPAAPVVSSLPVTSSAEPTPSRSVRTDDEHAETTGEDRVVAAYSIPTEGFGLRSAARLTVSAIGLADAQLRVQSDGQTVFDGLVAAGRRLSWDAADRFLLEASDGGDIRIDVLGRSLESSSQNRRVRFFVSRSSIWVEEFEPPTP